MTGYAGSFWLLLRLLPLTVYGLFPVLADSTSVADRCHDVIHSSSAAATGEDVRFDFEQQTISGCDIWTEAVWADCHNTCNESLPDVSFLQIQGCVRGCQTAVNIYTGEIVDSLNRWSRPGLVAGSKSNQSVTLQWAVAPRRTSAVSDSQLVAVPDVTSVTTSAGVNISFWVQKQVAGLSPDWIHHPAVRWLPRQRVRINGLQPYVTYKFRLVVGVSSDITFTSQESVPIAMEPYGAPQQPPEVISSSSSPTSIHLKWKPPFFIGAPLIGYRLTVTATGGSSSSSGHKSSASGGGTGTRVKEIVVQQTATADGTTSDATIHSEAVTMLKPDTVYQLTLAAINQYGRGPEATTVVRTQPDSPDNSQIGYLIVAVDNKIVKQDLNNLFSEPETLYEDLDDSVLVSAVAIHIKRGLVYFTTSREQIHRIELATVGVSANVTNVRHAAGSGTGGAQAASTHSAAGGGATVDTAGGVTWYSGSMSGSGLAVDWLNDRVYFTDENKIMVCDLNFQSCRVAVDKLDSTPDYINVNPCDGFLFWTQYGSGIYRADLSPSGSIASSSAPRRPIIRLPEPGLFVVDELNYQIYYASDDGTELMAANMDGGDPTPIRDAGDDGVVSWESLTALALHRPTETFYWSTAAGKLWAEELDTSTAASEDDAVRHQNEMLIDGRQFNGVHVWHSSTQSVPVPKTTPVRLQALFTTNSVLANWQEPEVDEGHGAWRNWSYELQVVNNATGKVLKLNALHQTNLTVGSLQPGTSYRICVRACSPGGCGPWSQDFVAQTLRQDSVEPFLVYADASAIFKSTLNMSNIQYVTNVTAADGVIRELSWFAHMLILVTDGGRVYSTFEGQPLTPLCPALNSVTAVAFDWLTDTLYWSSRQLNVIQRMPYSKALSSSSDSELRETVHQSSAPVLDLELDSVHGFMYWTTASTVERAHLDGQAHQVLLRLPNFSGRYVLGLTYVNAETERLYWLMKDAASQHSVYSADVRAGQLLAAFDDVSGTSLKPLCAVQGQVIIPTVEFYSNKLVWLSGRNTVSILDLAGCSVAEMSMPSSQVSAFTVQHAAKYQYPDNFTKSGTVVIPGEVDVENTLSVAGTAENYTIRWTPVNVQHGSVYYKVSLQWGNNPNGNNKLEQQIYQPSLSLVNVTKPWSWSQLTVRPCTYWGCAASTQTSFRSPMGAPSVPQRLRAFVTYQRGRRSKRRQQIRVDIRWSKPSEPAGVIIAYHVLMSTDTQADVWNLTVLRGEQPANKYNISDVPANTVLHFKVRACTEAACSPCSEIVSANTSVEKPVPRLVTSVNDSIRVLLPADDDESRSLTVIQAPVVALCYIAYDESFYWIDKNGNLMSSSSGTSVSSPAVFPGLGPGLGATSGGGVSGVNRTVKTENLGRLKGRGKSIVADWVDRNLYWLEEQTNEVQNAIMKYDLNRKPDQSDVVLVRPALILGCIQVSPKQRSLYWTETPPGGKGRLMKCRVDGTEIQPVIASQKHQQLVDVGSTSRGRYRPLRSSTSTSVTFTTEPCLACPDMAVSAVFALDHTAATGSSQMSSGHSTPSTESSSTSGSEPDVDIYIVNADSGDIWSMDSNGCNCRLAVNATDFVAKFPRSGLPPDSLTVDQDRLYWTNDAQQVMFSVDKQTGFDVVMESASSPVKTVLAFGDNLQPLPDFQCLKIVSYGRRPTLLSSTNNSLTLQLSPWQPITDCAGDTWRAPVKYTVFYYRQTVSQAETGGVILCDRRPGLCSVKETYDLSVVLTSLEPYVLYAVQVQATTYYTETPPPIAELDTVYLRTKAGIPSSPQNASATTCTPTQVNVKWRPPLEPHGRLEDIVYVIEWHTYNADGSRSEGRIQVSRKLTRSETSTANLQDRNGLLSATVNSLKHSHTYVIRVLAYDADMTGYSASLPATTRTYQNPFSVEVLSSTANVAQLAWTSSFDDSIMNHAIEYAEVRENKQWVPTSRPLNTTNATVYHKTIDNLRPSTTYAVRVAVTYRSGYRSVWPAALINTFTTNADVPGRPDSPWLGESVDGNTVVRWKAPSDSGSPIQQYQLDFRLSDSENWTTVYNGTTNEWIVHNGNVIFDQSYAFRVAARNLIGWGHFSNSSSAVIYQPRSIRKPDNFSIALALPLSILLMLTIVVFGILFITCRRRIDMKHGVAAVTGSTAGGMSSTDHELATLRELPTVTVQTANVLYNMNSVPTPEEVASLHHFHRDQIKLTMFLGSGAFGEVFEGLAAVNTPSDSMEWMKVAIKTLHKNASEFEKEEFLKEALLMSNFKHEHILHMLGVCLDNDPQFIILELMEGGDLLSYLRASRPTASTRQRLGLPDMISICLDICKGCEYLEDLHFVHRDLAARNCLISLTDNGHIVKIGDFGLARDIYKNDYYRKEGECLLPVRWMSPESLIDGVFTTQSDVWAFGVIVWEVLTLGQQPYPARTNTEVLHFVRSGGRLDRPDNCPDDLYHVMLKCWLYVPHARPSFKYLVQQFRGFMQRTIDPLDEFSGQHDVMQGEVRLIRSRQPVDCMSSSGSSTSGGGTHDRHMTIGSRKSMPAGFRCTRSSVSSDRRRRPRSDPAGSTMAAAAAAAAAYHDETGTESGYLQPLVASTLDRRAKYLELLNMRSSAASSSSSNRHQNLIGSLAAARMARAGASPLPPRS